MGDHKRAIVPIGTWTYLSPGLRQHGQEIDMGLFAEALIYYDEVLVVASNERVFAEFVRWFVDRQAFPVLLALLRDGAVGMYYYAFLTLPMLKDGSWSIWNTQDEEAAKNPVFEKRILESKMVSEVLTRGRHRAQLRNAIDGRIVEVKSETFGPAIDNARADYQDSYRVQQAVQAFVDDIAPVVGMSERPQVIATVDSGPVKTQIHWNVNFDQLSGPLVGDAKLSVHTPLTALAHSNRLIWSAAELGCDLYLHSPISVLVGDKLHESANSSAAVKTTIEELVAEVEFPDVRTLVNDGKMSLEDVLKFRAKAKLFRQWLQTQAERDGDALIAYHHEVAKEAGWVNSGRKLLRVFGSGVGAVAGAAGAAAVPENPVAASIAGQMAGGAAKYVLNVAAKINEDWRPVVFGRWARSHLDETS